jgi:hypothetical protein
LAADFVILEMGLGHIRFAAALSVGGFIIGDSAMSRMGLEIGRSQPEPVLDMAGDFQLEEAQGRNAGYGPI